MADDPKPLLAESIVNTAISLSKYGYRALRSIANVFSELVTNERAASAWTSDDGVSIRPKLKNVPRRVTRRLGPSKTLSSFNLKHGRRLSGFGNSE